MSTDTATDDPIRTCLDRWHGFLRDRTPEGLAELLHEDVTFWSPIVFTPQEGRDVTTLYLTAASKTLGGDPGSASGDDAGGGSGGGFRYVREVAEGHHAVLEFETTMDGKHVNGVDMITCDDDGRIVDFKVMIRPLQAINAVHAAMKAMLEQLAPPEG